MRQLKAPNFEEWIAEVEKLQAESQSVGKGVTTREIRDATGMGILRIRNILRKLKSAGRLIVTTKAFEAIAGPPQVVPSYIIRPDKRGKK